MDVMELRRGLLMAIKKGSDDVIVESVNAIAELIPNTYIVASNGETRTYNGWSSTDYIDITNGCVIYTATDIVYNGLYDENKNFISGSGYPNFSLKRSVNYSGQFASYYPIFIKLDQRIKYIRLSAETSIMQSAKIFRILRGTITNG